MITNRPAAPAQDALILWSLQSSNLGSGRLSTHDRNWMEEGRVRVVTGERSRLLTPGLDDVDGASTSVPRITVVDWDLHVQAPPSSEVLHQNITFSQALPTGPSQKKRRLAITCLLNNNAEPMVIDVPERPPEPKSNNNSTAIESSTTTTNRTCPPPEDERPLAREPDMHIEAHPRTSLRHDNGNLPPRLQKNPGHNIQIEIRHAPHGTGHLPPRLKKNLAVSKDRPHLPLRGINLVDEMEPETSADDVEMGNSTACIEGSADINPLNGERTANVLEPGTEDIWTIENEKPYLGDSTTFTEEFVDINPLNRMHGSGGLEEVQTIETPQLANSTTSTGGSEDTNTRSIFLSSIPLNLSLHEAGIEIETEVALDESVNALSRSARSPSIPPIRPPDYSEIETEVATSRENANTQTSTVSSSRSIPQIQLPGVVEIETDAPPKESTNTRVTHSTSISQKRACGTDVCEVGTDLEVPRKRPRVQTSSFSSRESQSNVSEVPVYKDPPRRVHALSNPIPTSQDEIKEYLTTLKPPPRTRPATVTPSDPVAVDPSMRSLEKRFRALDLTRNLTCQNRSESPPPGQCVGPKILMYGPAAYQSQSLPPNDGARGSFRMRARWADDRRHGRGTSRGEDVVRQLSVEGAGIGKLMPVFAWTEGLVGNIRVSVESQNRNAAGMYTYYESR
ncbi:hypothetical protein DXG01_016823 [Tephrocybe rancida]|nr:hypothetical protein DXG01_016823 [Tephrocybe rancida]